jgi:hypothetical protein
VTPVISTSPLLAMSGLPMVCVLLGTTISIRHSLDGLN